MFVNGFTSHNILYNILLSRASYETNVCIA
jgi:hypothetical protein